jgi:deazaflavin-dependent oxidoreductase (nitroreductase family)
VTRLAFLRTFTIRFVNPVTRRFAGRVPGFAIVHHVGRATGRPYATPMNVFRDGEAWVMALTYGAEVQWVRNVLATGGCELEVRGRRLRLTDPELIHDPSRRLMPIPVRWFLGLLGVTDFLRLHPA